jgi:hypothetical protein
MSIYNRHVDNTSTDECRYMIDEVSFAFLPLYVDHMLPLATVFCDNVFINYGPRVDSASNRNEYQESSWG